MSQYNTDGSYTQAADPSIQVHTHYDERANPDYKAHNDGDYVIFVGAQHWMRYAHTATDWNDNEIKWTNINTPGPGFLIDKQWNVEYELKVSIHDIPVTSTDRFPFRSNEPCIGLRAYPLNYVAESIGVMINNRYITCNPHIYLYPRMEYWPQRLLKYSNGCCPHRKHNGQTFADMELRKNNSPFCNLSDFNDQDYPNTALTTIVSTKFVPGTVARGSSFERNARPRTIRLATKAIWSAAASKANKGNEYDTFPGGKGNNADAAKIVGDNDDWGTPYLTFTAAKAIRIWELAENEYLNIIKGEPYNGQVTFEFLQEAKKKAGEEAVKTLEADTSGKYWASNKNNDERLIDFKCDQWVGKWIDLDLIPDEYISGLLDCYRAFYHEKGAKEATVYYYQNCCLTPGSYELICRIREPVIAEPLDYTSSNETGRTMFNINNIELKYNLSNYLNSMLMIDDYRLLANSDSFWLYNHHLKYVKGQRSNMELLNDEHINVHINAAPQLIFNVATPFVVPRVPFICQHKQFKRFESHDSEDLNVKSDALISTYMNPETARQRPIKTRSANLSLTFHPNSIFIWVAQKQSDRNKSPDKFTRADSYAKINKLTITYGNSSNLLAQFDDHELFQMSLRNGLQDRSFLDWNATMKNITTPTDFYGNAANLGWTARRYVDQVGKTVTADGTSDTLVRAQTEPSYNPAYNRYAGIGSVVRLVPGIDLVNGNGTNPLIAGMRAGSATIQIEAEFIPLNAYEETDYALNVMFEYDGVCTIRPSECDLGMIAIESFEQIKNAPRVQTLRENSYAYGAGIGDNVLKGIRLAQNVIRNSGIVTRRHGSGFINGIGNRSVKMSGGKLISQRDLFKAY